MESVAFALVISILGLFSFGVRKTGKNEQPGNAVAPPVCSEHEAAALIARKEPVWIFKHSLACPLSWHALREFSVYVQAHPQQAVAIVAIQQHPAVSEYVARTLKVRHESPQVVLVCAGGVLWHASHGAISAAALQAAWQDYGANRKVPPAGE